MRVLQVHNRYRQRGGEDTVVEAEAQLLRSRGHEVRSVTPTNPRDPRGAAANLLMAAWNPVSARELTKTAARVRPDIVHVHNTWFSLTPSVLWALQRAGFPVVLTAHNYRIMCSNALLFRDGAPCEKCVGSHPWHGARHRCYNDSRAQSVAAAATISLHRRLGTWANVDRVVALTDFARAKLEASGIPSEVIATKGNFTDDPGPRRSRPGGGDTALFVGRLTEEKGTQHLLRAWDAANIGDMTLDMVGDGPLRDRCKETRGVRLLGGMARDEVRRLMMRARVLVCPSQWYEGLPTVILEAFAAGIPVLGSDLGGIRHAVEPLGPSWLVPPTSQERWIDALRWVAKADEDVNLAGEKARRAYESHYSPRVAGEQLEALYAAAIASSIARRAGDNG